MSEQEREFERLKNKARLWKELHPRVSGYCALCPHLMDIEWCRENPRLVWDKKKDKASIQMGEMHDLTIGGGGNIFGYGCECLEWIKNV